jgi:hypothetical protein
VACASEFATGFDSYNNVVPSHAPASEKFKDNGWNTGWWGKTIMYPTGSALQARLIFGLLVWASIFLWFQPRDAHQYRLLCIKTQLL